MKTSSSQNKKNYFDNLPILSKEEALNILAKPIDQLELSSDYYKAVFHLFKYPAPDTEKALLSLAESNSSVHSVVIAKRKAIEVLGRHGCVNAIPAIGRCLASSDPYLVENAAWSLKELACTDRYLIKHILRLIDDPKQNRRVLIQSLGTLGGVAELSRLKLFSEDTRLPPGVRGASIAAVKKLSGESDQINELVNYLSLPNQNQRQCAVNDIIDAGATDLLDFILKSPVAPSFRMRALNILWPKNLESINGLDLFSAIDLLVTDDPNNLENLGDYPTIMEDSYHIQELLNTDFRRSYLSLKILIKMDPDDIWMTLSKYIHKIKIDYGGLYFLMILFRSVSGWNEDALVEIKAITRSCLGSNWPEFMKFKPAAILTLMQLEPETAVGLVPKWLDESTTPFWASRYATLIALEKLMKNDKSFILHSSVLSNRNDTHRFVDAKIRDMELKFYI